MDRLLPRNPRLNYSGQFTPCHLITLELLATWSRRRQSAARQTLVLGRIYPASIATKHCPQHTLLSIEVKCGPVVLFWLQILVFLAKVAVANREDIQLVSHEAAERALRVAYDRLACAAVIPCSLTGFTDLSLNSPLNTRLAIAHLRSHHYT